MADIGLGKHVVYEVVSLLDPGGVGIIALDDPVDGHRIALGGIVIDLQHRVQKLRDTIPGPADRRTHRHAKQPAELPGVDTVTPCLQFVVHVQGHHGPEIHVLHLRCKIEVPFQVGSIHDIDDHVRDVPDEIVPDELLLRGKGGKGICPRKVHEKDLPALPFETAFLGIDGYTAVVTDVFVAAGSQVEDGCLAAVGIAYEGHPDGPVVSPVIFLLGRDFNQGSLLAPERHLVAKYLIFNGILEGSVHDHINLLPRDEAHLDEPLVETACPAHLFYYSGSSGL